MQEITQINNFIETTEEELDKLKELCKDIKVLFDNLVEMDCINKELPFCRNI